MDPMVMAVVGAVAGAVIAFVLLTLKQGASKQLSVNAQLKDQNDL